MSLNHQVADPVADTFCPEPVLANHRFVLSLSWQITVFVNNIPFPQSTRVSVTKIYMYTGEIDCYVKAKATHNKMVRKKRAF
jgi:hypothetical protein